MQTHKTVVVSSNSTCVTIKAPFVRKAKKNHLNLSASLENTPFFGALSLVFATLEIEYATQFL